MAFTKKEIKALILYYERVRPGFVGLKNRTQALKASSLGSKLESTEMTKGWFGRMTKGWFGRTKRGPQRRCLFPCRQAPPC